MAKRTTIRHALLLVFEFKPISGALDTPNPLLAMDTDLKLAYTMARERFRVPPQNITVVTDIRPRRGTMGPWDPLNEDPLKNPRIVRLYCPDITKICREIAQFVENTVRGIREVAMKGGEVTHEVFIYISGHGAQIPNPCRHADNDEEMDNALIFTSADGKTRKYLRDDHIFRILFGQIDVDENGVMAVPITSRKLRKSKTDGSLYYNFSDELVTFQVTPGVKDHVRPVIPGERPDDFDIVAQTPRGRRLIRDRGLPAATQMLTIIDTCHAGTMTDFHFIYNPRRGTMELTRKPPNSRFAFPLCICLAAACDTEEAPSTSNGSAFTRHLFGIFNQLRGTVSIREIHDMIYENLPKLLEKCGPTITATFDDPEFFLPLLDNISYDLPLLPVERTTYSRAKSDELPLPGSDEPDERPKTKLVEYQTHRV